LIALTSKKSTKAISRMCTTAVRKSKGALRTTWGR
jgi:hypothetical protein